MSGNHENSSLLAQHCRAFQNSVQQYSLTCHPGIFYTENNALFKIKTFKKKEIRASVEMTVLHIDRTEDLCKSLAPIRLSVTTSTVS